LIRPASEDDLDRIGETLAFAFEHDPVWGWAFSGGSDDDRGRERKLRALGEVFGFFAAAALAHEWVWLNEDGAAVALWIPPECQEMSAEDVERFPALPEPCWGRTPITPVTGWA
jgi:hypothetical protein